VSLKKRKLRAEIRHAIKVEAAKLLDVGFVEEAHYTTWLANVILVKNSTKNGKYVWITMI